VYKPPFVASSSALAAALLRNLRIVAPANSSEGKSHTAWDQGNKLVVEVVF
ncbi:hypothetical protein AVEN_122126-1, partial [Araneus ventricosus]